MTKELRLAACGGSLNLDDVASIQRPVVSGTTRIG